MKKTTVKQSAVTSLPVYDDQGKEVRIVSLPENIFSSAWNPDLVHQVVVAMEANERAPIAHTKGRGEVSGGGRKPWRQKGTGRARHGSNRSPIWRGGGVTHGPTKERDYSKKINRRMAQLALASVLSKKAEEGEVLFVDLKSFSSPSAKTARATLGALSKIAGYAPLMTKKKNAAVIALPTRDLNIEKSFRNFRHISVVETRNVNPVSLLSNRFVIFVDPEESFTLLSNRIQ